ncbi:MAG TPA: hypothetical protein VHW01_06080 [Polyangiaceae bacterium]|nr:hypothetical protein [Polyangiaceae bacterium]
MLNGKSVLAVCGQCKLTGEACDVTKKNDCCLGEGDCGIPANRTGNTTAVCLQNSLENCVDTGQQCRFLLPGGGTTELSAAVISTPTRAKRSRPARARIQGLFPLHVTNGCRSVPWPLQSAPSMLPAMFARTLTGMALVVACSACGGHASSNSMADAGTTSDGASDAEAGVAVVNAPRPRLTCGASSSCYLTDSGSVRCWGNGEFGQLGNGAVDSMPLPPTTVQGVSSAVGLAGGALQACALSASDQAQCWGVLPSASAANLTTPTPTAAPLQLSGVATIAFSQHACALTGAGLVYCWGPDSFLGNGEGPSDSPVQVNGIENAIDVAVNESSELGSGIATLVVLANGSVLGWGHAHGPGLTTSASADQLTPVAMPGLTNIRQITLSSKHACALLENGQVSCWGANDEGQLGVPAQSAPSAAPQSVTGLDEVVEVRAGDAFTCARRSNGEVWCWGDNTFFQLATAEPVAFSRQPIRINVPAVTDLAVGQAHVCVRTTDGGVSCWGNNGAGQVLLSGPTMVPVPTRVMP